MFRPTRFLAAAMALPALALFGCGGGGGGLAGGTLAGVVTDAEGSAVAGATVTAEGRSTVSQSNGSFTLDAVDTGYRTVKAEVDIRGVHWSGETNVDVTSGAQNRSLNVVVSDQSTQGVISGYISDSRGFPISGAKVFVAGPVGSTLGVADNNGAYAIRRLASGFSYSVTASFAGFTNDHATAPVTAGQTTNLDFTLTRSNTQTGLAAPQNVSAQTWTISSVISRANDPSRGVYDWLRQLYRTKKGLPSGAQATHIERKMATRATPDGSLIEVDLFWDFQRFDNLFGYLIRRGTAPASLADEAILRDPESRAFFDLDFALTPDRTYYYTVHRLDTIGFPNSGLIGPASAQVSATPFQPCYGQSPAQGATVSGNPTFQWTAVPGAFDYQIYVFDRFPDLQSSSDPNGVVSIWQGNGSLVQTPATQATYQGPALQPGHTYYWMVVAADQNLTTLSATEVRKFTKQ